MARLEALEAWRVFADAKPSQLRRSIAVQVIGAEILRGGHEPQLAAALRRVHLHLTTEDEWTADHALDAIAENGVITR